MKVISLIQARTHSTRLPGKINVDLYKGWTILDILSHKLSGLPFMFAVPDQDHNFFKEVPVISFKGKEEDVLHRFLTIAKLWKPEILVRICADNAFIDPLEIEEMVRILDEDKDSIYVNNWEAPEGCRMEVFRVAALKDMAKLELTDKHTEHVTLAIREFFPEKCRALPKKYGFPTDVNIALDTKVDLRVIRDIFLKEKRWDIRECDLWSLYQTDPEIFEPARKEELAGLK